MAQVPQASMCSFGQDLHFSITGIRFLTQPGHTSPVKIVFFQSYLPPEPFRLPGKLPPCSCFRGSLAATHKLCANTAHATRSCRLANRLPFGIPSKNTFFNIAIRPSVCARRRVALAKFSSFLSFSANLLGISWTKHIAQSGFLKFLAVGLAGKSPVTYQTFNLETAGM